MGDGRGGLVVVALLGTAVAMAHAGGQDDLGARVYAERCVACHGTDGLGDGPVAAALTPPPRNFRDAGFWRERSLADLERTVRDGRPGTLMQPFAGALTDAEITAVVRYLERFRPEAASHDQAGRDGEISGGGGGENPAGRRDRD